MPAEAATPALEPLVRVSGLSKSFPGIRALDAVDFELRPGEIHMLLGGNGAGKSTMIRILAGVEVPDSGTVHFRGRALPRGDVAGCLAAGIRTIHQEISLVPELTVGENICLGQEPGRWRWLVSRRRIERRAAELIEDLGFPLEVRQPVRGLSVGRRQLVEIARALSMRPRVLVLDEPTAALDESETERLFHQTRRLRERGIGLIWITHRLEEVFRIGDRVTVLRDGKSVFHHPVEGLGEGELVEHLVGRRLKRHDRQSRVRHDEVLLEVRGLGGLGFEGIELTLHRGEVIGLAGQMGSGRSELARALAGIDPIRTGEVRLAGRRLALRGPGSAIRAGLVLVPEDRRQQGFFPSLDVRANLTLPDIAEWLRFGLTRGRRRHDLARRLRERLGVRARLVGQAVETLSGGNQQKVVIGKWLGSRRQVLILDEPTRGIDVGAKEEVFAIVDQLAAEGLGVIFISSELSEVIRASDRILVLREGRPRRLLDSARVGEEELTHLAAGSDDAPPSPAGAAPTEA